MTIGTSYFLSFNTAVRYYSDYESNPVSVVNRKLLEKEIHLGRPDIKDGERLIVIDNGTRYAIVEGDK